MMCSIWPGRSVRTASISSNGSSDSTARRRTQTHVSKRSDDLRRLARIGTDLAILAYFRADAVFGFAAGEGDVQYRALRDLSDGADRGVGHNAVRHQIPGELPAA